MEKIIAACIFLSAQIYGVPPAVLVGIYQAEGGTVGQEVGPNSNGTYDLGPMQINTVWMPELAKKWGVSEYTARQWVRDDPCINVEVSTWILRNHLDETGDLSQAIAHYHSRTPHFGEAYEKRVVSLMDRYGLIHKPR